MPAQTILYQVTGDDPVRVEVMEYVSLDHDQFKARAQLVELVYRDDRYLVRAYEQLEFLPGETIGLVPPPRDEIAGSLTEV